MSTKYLIINPFYRGTLSSSGTDHYCRNLQVVLAEKKPEITPLLVNKDPNESVVQFWFRLRRLLRTFDPRQTIIEVPESLGWANLIPKDFFVHIRLHCALTIARRFDGQKRQGWLEFRERRGLVQGDYLSSPSLLMAEETRHQFGIDKKIHVFPHLPPCEAWTGESERDIDILVLGRAQRLKGLDNLDALISTLPENLNIVVAGIGFSDFKFSRRDISILGEQNNDEKMGLYRRAKCLALLSRFESYSLVAAEAILNGAHVVCWDKVGLSEWVNPQSGLTTIPLEGFAEAPTKASVNRFAESVAQIVKGVKLAPSAETHTSLENGFFEGFHLMLGHFADSIRTNG